MTANLDATIDTTAAVVKAIGDTATAAMQVGNVVLPILQDIGLFFPPGAIAANYVAVALPYITDVAKYAPAVSSGLETGKPMIEAAIGVGAALLDPLNGLLNGVPGLAEAHVFFADLNAWFVDNAYTPQDPRFERASTGANAP